MYKIVITQRAVKDISKLDKKMKERIAEKLHLVAQNPVLYSKKLTNPKIGTYRLRIGEYRVIFDLENSTMIVLRIGHRKEIYQ